MNSSVYVGQKALSITEYEKLAPITGVILWVDDKNCYKAGDETGTVIEQDCPYASQEMANSLLATLQGYSYQGLEANGAKVSPIAELGDGLTVDGLYTQLAYQNIRFSTGKVMDVAAPGSDETLHEYKTEGQTTKQFAHQIAETKSLISKTRKEILLQVENELEGLSSSFSVQLDNITGRVNGLDGEFKEFSLTLDGLTVTDSTGKTVINGSMIQTSNLYVNAANISGTLTANQINLTGAITWSDLASDAQGKVNSASSLASTANQNATTANNTISGWKYQGTTYIDGSKIQTGTVTASTIQGGEVQLLASDKTQVGILGITAAQTSGIAINLTSLGALRFRANEGNLYISADGHNFPTYIELSNNEIILGALNSPQYSYVNPNRSGVTSFGSIAVQYRDIFLNNPPTIISDRMAKSEISYDIDKYEKFFELLKPVSFRLARIEGSGLHLGLIAQDVEEAMSNAGLSADDFSALVKGKGTYALRYEEFIPLLIQRVQNLTARIEELEAKS